MGQARNLDLYRAHMNSPSEAIALRVGIVGVVAIVLVMGAVFALMLRAGLDSGMSDAALVSNLGAGFLTFLIYSSLILLVASMPLTALLFAIFGLVLVARDWDAEIAAAEAQPEREWLEAG